MEQLSLRFDNFIISGGEDIAYRKQNTKENQKILDDNLPKFNYQCRLVHNLLSEGKRLTVCQASIGYFDRWEKHKITVIGDLRARIRDLRKHYEIKDQKYDGGFKEYFL